MNKYKDKSKSKPAVCKRIRNNYDNIVDKENKQNVSTNRNKSEIIKTPTKSKFESQHIKRNRSLNLINLRRENVDADRTSFSKYNCSGEISREKLILKEINRKKSILKKAVELSKYAQIDKKEINSRINFKPEKKRKYSDLQKDNFKYISLTKKYNVALNKKINISSIKFKDEDEKLYTFTLFNDSDILKKNEIVKKLIPQELDNDVITEDDQLDDAIEYCLKIIKDGINEYRKLKI